MKSERKIWKVNGFVAGYVNSAVAATSRGDGSGLTRIVILGGGHYTPMDQPVNSLIMIGHMIEGNRLDLS